MTENHSHITGRSPGEWLWDPTQCFTSLMPCLFHRLSCTNWSHNRRGVSILTLPLRFNRVCRRPACQTKGSFCESPICWWYNGPQTGPGPEREGKWEGWQDDRIDCSTRRNQNHPALCLSGQFCHDTHKHRQLGTYFRTRAIFILLILQVILNRVDSAFLLFDYIFF